LKKIIKKFSINYIKYMDSETKINVYSCSDGISIDQIRSPDLFSSPVRIDILQFVHQSMAKNKRQAYSVSSKAGMKTSAKSWGTGRAVARVPRVPGSGTHRSGQGAIANFCRGGRIFAPTKVWRKWHHKINKNQRRQAILSAISASAIVSLVFARGHDISRIPELPLIIESAIESVTKTKEAEKILTKVGVIKEIVKNKKNKKIRPGIGKMRNRKFRNYKGPLLIYENSVRPFKIIPTLSICNLNALNLLKLAPGGHVGRLCIWSYNAFIKLEKIEKMYLKNSEEKKQKRWSKPDFSFEILKKPTRVNLE
jgi:large subunit ribosomal protein L4e